MPESTPPWVLFSTAYLPPISYLLSLAKFLIRGDCRVGIDLTERYQKQSYRNRAEIMDSQGRQRLVVPVVHQREEKLPSGEAPWVRVEQVAVDYSTPWPRLHMGAIRAAYARSPYYSHFFDAFAECISDQPPLLHTLNTRLLGLLIQHLFGRDMLMAFEANWGAYRKGDPVRLDLRSAFHPKHSTAWYGVLPFALELPSYYQLFSDRLPFEEDLSALDYLFCEGSARHLL